MERERLPEQIVALEGLVRSCEENEVELVLVAGDVFDTYLPSAEAEEAFFRAAKALAGETRAVVVISGNHDDGVRLAASAPLAGEEGIYIFGGTSHPFIAPSNRPVRAVEADERHIVIENSAGERVYVNVLPYPNEARLREEKTDESYAEKVSRWIAAGEAKNTDMPRILLSHLFVAGSKPSDSERDIGLGGARAVPLSVFPEGEYAALGHLHRRQHPGGSVFYSGSLLQYSFDENPDKSAYLLETEGTSVRIAKQIPITGGKQLVRLECRGVEEALALLPRYPSCFVELTLHLDKPLTTAETEALRASNEGLVSLLARVRTEEAPPAESRVSLGDGELFEAYYRSQYGAAPSEELKTAFLKLLSEEA